MPLKEEQNSPEEHQESAKAPGGFSRRSFLKGLTGTAAGLGLSQIFNPALVSALEKGLENHPVVWIQGQGCTGCSVSLLNSVDPSIKKVLLDIISLQYHPTVMASEGETAIENLYRIAEAYKGKFSLVIEGAIPMAANGKYCVVGERGHHEITMLEMTKELGEKAGSVLAVGTCAAFGGIPAAKGNLTEATSVEGVFKKFSIKTPVINIPGCPSHPDWIVGTIAHLLTKGMPELDSYNCPVLFFGENIHENCPYLDYYEQDIYSRTLSDKKGCRMDVGCKGPDTYADCFRRKWNSGMNWCVENAVCIGCVNPGFPDSTAPFYESL
ncbi:MAG TPA: NiFeSe hydrogenase small subunit [Desulfobacteraceae bacterium]|nr:NiFeSe hydrogenase small subunit [Desulfobacteraceae bacterium]